MGNIEENIAFKRKRREQNIVNNFTDSQREIIISEEIFEKAIKDGILKEENFIIDIEKAKKNSKLVKITKITKTGKSNSYWVDPNKDKKDSEYLGEYPKGAKVNINGKIGEIIGTKEGKDQFQKGDKVKFQLKPGQYVTGTVDKVGEDSKGKYVRMIHEGKKIYRFPEKIEKISGEKEISKEVKERLEKFGSGIFDRKGRKISELHSGNFEDQKAEKFDRKDWKPIEQRSGNFAALGYDAKQVSRMSARTMTEVIDKKIPAKDVSILPDGSYMKIEDQKAENLSDNNISLKQEKSVLYKTDVGKIQVALHYSEHKKNWYVQGSLYGKLEIGGSSVASTIKGCIKKFIQDNDLKMSDKITHYNYGIHGIYGIYAVYVK